MARPTILAVFAAWLSLVAFDARADAPTTAPTDAASSPFEWLAGTYAFVGGDAEIAAKNAAIDRATDDMFFATRGLARSKLRDVTQPRSPMGIAFTGGDIVVTATPTAKSPASGASVPYKTGGGETVKLSQRVTAEGKLVQSLVGDNGTRSMTLTLGPDGKTLALQAVIESKRLPLPVRYTLTYRRN